MYFRYEINSHNVGNTSCNTSGASNIYRRLEIYCIVITTLMTVILPLFFLCVLNTLLVKALRGAQRSKVETELVTRDVRATKDIPMNANQNRCTRILYSVVLVFVVCQIPSLVSMIISLVLKTQNSMFSVPIMVFGYSSGIAAVSQSLNSACNFLIYFLVGKRFRQLLWEWLVCSHRCSDS